MNYYKPLVHIVSPAEDGQTLKTIIRDRMGVSRKLLSRLKLTEQGITVNGRRSYISMRVQTGDRIELRMQQEISEQILPQPIPLDPIYEDEHLLILNKQAGMIVHPTHGHYLNTIANGVVYMWMQRGELCRFRPVHRLDQETSGVLAIAKHPYAHQQISEQLKNGQVDKQYVAVVRGLVPADEGTIDAPIGRNPAEPHKRIVTEAGYRAVTHYRVERRCEELGLTFVRLRLETGRTHQIRVHMAYLGHPLAGDKLYGAFEQARDNELDIRECIGRQALHAVKLGLYHPVGGNWVEFSAPVPNDMLRLLITN